MARLNEPPIAPAPAPAPSGDEIDAVKRRCLRQNRELAKINSQQSIRIRTLENDASRLLAENLSLREQILQLQNLLEAQSNRPSFENIDTIKEQLEAKMQEFGALIAGLGPLGKSDNECRPQLAATKKSAEERQWRSGLGLQEVENAMMPTIVEDKYYPRRTMNTNELHDMLDEPDNQSPDIGPPPVSRFETEDPIAFNASPPPEEDQPADLKSGYEPSLPHYLETRKKRRESGPKPNMRRVAAFDSPSDDSEENATKPVRVGAKRKFSVQEDDDKSHPPAEPFQFSRRNAPAPSENSEESRAQSPHRPVLASKPVNTDPVLSPKKQRSSSAEKSEKPEKKGLPKTGRSRMRHVQPELPVMDMPPPISVAEINLESLPPKTPAAELIFSPPSTEPSTSRPESKDTPPPGDLSASNQIGQGGRPSRRARPQVSYKEPSLSTKMRRPGKELVDAVIVDQGHRMSTDAQTAPSTVDRISIKQELGDSAWKPMSAVVGCVGEEVEVGSPLRQKMDRKEGAQDLKTDAPKLNSAAASNAISALISETSTAKRKSLNIMPVTESTESKPQPRHTESNRSATKQDDLAIFDFNESSPATSDNPPVPPATAAPSNPRLELAKAARAARRHSSMAAAASNEERKVSRTEKTDTALPSVHKRTGSGTIRSSSTMSLAKSTAAARASTKDRESRERRNNGAPPNAAKVEGDRADRAESRRRSMMI